MIDQEYGRLSSPLTAPASRARRTRGHGPNAASRVGPCWSDWAIDSLILWSLAVG